VSPPGEVLIGALPRARRQVVADLVALTKPRVVLMVLVTAAVGYYVALSGPPDWVRLVNLLIGMALAAGGTLALNQYMERDIDALMERTRLRPLPDGRLAPLEALLFASTIVVGGVLYLAAFVTLVAAAVTAVTALLYLFAYTPLKVRTSLCMIVGAIPGALPPVSGWAAARDDVGLGAWVLFGILFLWQLPHTLAIARLYREDYARGGIRVLPVVDPDGGSTERHMLNGSLSLLAVSLLPTLIGLSGPLYFGGALACGLGVVFLGLRYARTPSAPAARRVLLASLLYLPVILALLAFDKV
jgi:protoheme IX farnesyltransferase